MNIVRSSLAFFIGAATRGSGENKWSWPARDLPYLYRREWRGSINSMEPDMDTWIKFGMVTCDNDRGETIALSVNSLVDAVGIDEVKDMIERCSGMYLSESKDATLDKLGCPR